jgi:hypothetical protein
MSGWWFEDDKLIEVMYKTFCIYLVFIYPFLFLENIFGTCKYCFYAFYLGCLCLILEEFFSPTCCIFAYHITTILFPIQSSSPHHTHILSNKAMKYQQKQGKFAVAKDESAWKHPLLRSKPCEICYFSFFLF